MQGRPRCLARLRVRLDKPQLALWSRLTQLAALPADDGIPKIAAVVTAYYHNSHADVLVSRLLETETLDGKGRVPKLKLVSLYTDQVPKNDKSRLHLFGRQTVSLQHEDETHWRSFGINRFGTQATRNRT